MVPQGWVCAHMPAILMQCKTEEGLKNLQEHLWSEPYEAELSVVGQVCCYNLLPLSCFTHFEEYLHDNTLMPASASVCALRHLK